MGRRNMIWNEIGDDGTAILSPCLTLPVRSEQILVLLISTGECAVMCVMELFADAPCKVGVGRGDDHSLGCFGLILDLDDSCQGMLGFDASLFIVGKPENLLPMRGDEFPGEQEDSARCAVANPFTGRARDLVTARRGRPPRPSPPVIQRLALTADRWLQEFALGLVWVVLPGSNRSIFFIPGKM
jgi:hypothetical protein